MTEKIGKYRILERIGRGGMGTVFKAHDPVLNRQVALKVISGDVEVTDELKARFYREARACAKLNHRNIIVVYDMGEEGEHLFIVMELLEGEELKHVIAQRKSLSLEDKLSAMIQICSGLQYAHQMGIVHRDVKPGNIFLLRSGQVKVLDFGIARITSGVDSGLTRTGLIMGTLRYMSPEQARGRVDHRSDIYSVGMVFYELLTYRHAFESDDPMQILEQLRAVEPPSLTSVDPTIPPELATIIERAYRKDPAERYQDLGQMGADLEGIRRKLTEGAEEVRGQVRARLEEIRTLRADLSGHLGDPREDTTLPVVDEGAPVAGLQALEADLLSQIEHMQARLSRAAAVEPILTRGRERLQAGDPDAAITDFEQVLQQVPEHRRALEALGQARREAATRREPALAAPAPAAPAVEPPAAAPPAPPERAPTPVVARPPAAAPRAPPERAPTPVVAKPPTTRAPAAEVAPVRSSAAAPMELGLRLERPTRARPRGGRRLALAAGVLALLVSGGLVVYWAGGGTRTADQAVPGPVSGAQARSEAEGAQKTMLAAREAASQAEVERLAPAVWAAAGERAREADAAFGRQDYPRAQAGYKDAQQAFVRATEGARTARVAQQQGSETERARAEAEGARRAAELVDAPKLAEPSWTRAAGMERDAADAAKQNDPARAQRLYTQATLAYQEATGEASKRGATREAQRKATEQLGAVALAARRDAERTDASRHAPRTFALAQEREKEGQAALGRQDYVAAQSSYREAQQAYQRAGQEAQQAAEAETREAAREAQRREAGELRDLAVQARTQAEQADAKRWAPKPWADATAHEAEGQGALGQRDYAAARDRFREAQQEYQRAAADAQKAGEAPRERERRDAEQFRGQMAQARSQAEQADARRWASRGWTDAGAREGEGQAALGRREYALAQQRFREARQDYLKAALDARQAAEADRRASAKVPEIPKEAPGRPPDAGDKPKPPESQPGRPKSFGESVLGVVKRVFVGQLQGISGPVAWQVVEVKTDTVPDRRELRWSYTLILKETEGSAIQFERVVHSIRRDDVRPIVTDEPFPRRLESKGELRVPRVDGVSFGAGGTSTPTTSEGLVVWQRLFGKDAKGKELVIDIQFRL